MTKRLLCAIWCSFFATAAGAQDSNKSWEEYDKLLAGSETLAAIGPTLFGDAVNLENGALTFSTVDVALPGNNALPVEFRRTFTVGNRKGYRNDAPLADWDIDVPRVGGVFAPTWKDARCTATTAAQGQPPPVTVGSTVFSAADYWHGNHATMPGGGEMLVANASVPQPATGGPYRWLTAGFTYFACLPTIRNGSGEGFLAITADGTRYWFDWMAQTVEPPLSAARPVNPGNVTVPRRNNQIYATRVEDRFGNWVRYTFTNASTERPRLTAIEASDGRRLDVDYTGSGYVERVRSGTRTWTYSYETLPVNTVTLSSVTLPDASRWTIDFDALASAEIRYEQGAPGKPIRSCESPGLVATPGATGTITHPSGAVGEFTVDPWSHGRSNVPMVCTNWTSPNNDPNDDVAYYPVAYDAFSLTRKRVTGPGLVPAEWNYNYDADISFAPGTGPLCTSGTCIEPICTSDTCAGSSRTIVAGPDNTWTRYTFGNSYRYNEGKLLKTERGSGPAAVKKTETATYLLDTAGQNFPVRVGISPQPRGDGYTSEYPRPRRRNVILQDGATFTWEVDTCGAAPCFDAFGRPTSINTFSWLSNTEWDGYQRRRVTAYHDNLAAWVVGQVATSTLFGARFSEGVVEKETIYDPVTAMPVTRKTFGKVDQTLAYNADGTIRTVKDGLQKTTTLASWKRGIPQSITYADSTTESAVVDDNGWIRSTTDENSYTTTYDYDAMGRLATKTYPSGDTTAWNVVSRAFERVDVAEVGLPAGHWRHTTSTGNARTIQYLDALWRPVVTEEYDAADIAGTRRYTRRAYDASARPTFESYAGTTSTLTTGTRTGYDVLDRVTSVAQDSELGTLTTTTEYLTGFQTRVTNPRGYATTTMFHAYDEPTTEFPRVVTLAQDNITVYTPRNAIGQATSLYREGPNGNQWFNFHYDAHQRLCKEFDSNTRQYTVTQHDAADNVVWTASANALLYTLDCDHDYAYASGHRIDRTYDERNRLKTISYPDGLGNQTWFYWPDGLPEHITTANQATTLTNSYVYNKRRLLTDEHLVEPSWYDQTISYRYDGNGVVSSVVYPSGTTVDFAPNALGQATRAGSHATGATYHPNGALARFTYGNGIVHTMSQNARKLPERSTDTGSSGAVLDLRYVFDRNGNVQSITDFLPSGRTSRTMTYDALDRLRTTTSPMYGPTGVSYTYDAADNLTRVVAPGRDHTYVYTGGRVSSVRNTVGGATVANLAYDAQGNVATKGTQNYVFDYGNRLREVTSREGYRYDAYGRRSLSWSPTLGLVLSRYAQNGQLLYQSNERNGKTTEYVYLAGSLVGSFEPFSRSAQARYDHTDALGSPVASTNAKQSVIETSEYEPNGALLNRPNNDTPGFTGHVMDAQTGLTYMQQRYYDPMLGLFLSIDPVGPDTQTGANIHRYRFARSNPFRFSDPDGRYDWDMFSQGVIDAGNADEASFNASRAYRTGVLLGGIADWSADGFATTRFPKGGSAQPRGATGPAPAPAAKAVPNPHGRLGSPEHRDTVANRATELASQGHTVVAGGGQLPERSVVTPDGRRRYPDISTIDPNGNPYHENVGRSTASGEPVARERRALDDIRSATGTEPGYTPYDR